MQDGKHSQIVHHFDVAKEITLNCHVPSHSQMIAGPEHWNTLRTILRQLAASRRFITPHLSVNGR